MPSAIDDFPGDALLWRIEWIGGVGYNTSVPSDPQISICLAQLPAGQTDPLSARSRSSQTKRTVRIGVGLLPYISIASVWQQRRPVITGSSVFAQAGVRFSSSAFSPDALLLYCLIGLRRCEHLKSRRLERLVVGSDRTTCNHNGFRLSCK